MRSFFLPICATLGLLGGALTLDDLSRGEPSAPLQEADEDPFGELVTLWAHDPASASFDFARGGYGGRLDQGQMLYDESHLVFDVYEPDHLSVAFTRDGVASVVDLGRTVVDPIRNPRHLAPKAPLPIYFNLIYESKRNRFVLQGTTRGTTRFRAAEPVLGPLQRTPVQHWAPGIGHTYLMRFKSDIRNSEDVLVKLLVVDFKEDRYVTFRWKRVR